MAAAEVVGVVIQPVDNYVGKPVWRSAGISSVKENQ
jgi:hypothetical protein